MIKNYTVQTFVAWWIGAGIGFIFAALTVSDDGWTTACTVTAIYTTVLFAVYGLQTQKGDQLLERAKARLARFGD